jgi:hypothetical protein
MKSRSRRVPVRPATEPYSRRRGDSLTTARTGGSFLFGVALAAVAVVVFAAIFGAG